MPLPLYEAIAFNTQTNLIDIIGAFPPSLVYPNTIALANQNLAAGALVSLANIGGTIQVINAFALSTAEAPALGFVLQAVTAGQPATVFTVGNYFVPGFVIADVGQTVYLSATTPGHPTLTPPVSPNLIQPVGVIIAVDGSGNATIAWSLDQSTAGIVSSVGLSLPPDFIVSGSPVTSAGVLTAVWAAEPVNFVLAGPVGNVYGSGVYGSGVYSAITVLNLYGFGTYGSGGYSSDEGPPAFRALVVADLPSLTASDLSNGVTGSGAIVLSISPTFTGTVTAAEVAVSGPVRAATYQLGTAGPMWTSGAGVPSGAPPAAGSLYSNTSGGVGTSLYVWNGTFWQAVA